MILRLSISLLLAASAAFAAELPIIPRPQQIVRSEGTLLLTKQTRIEIANSSEAGMLTSVVTAALNARNLPENSGGHPVPVVFEWVPTATGKSAESYQLKISPEGIAIRGSDAGLFYGAQTLAQWISHSPRQAAGIALPCVEIEDAPRFAWRGFMLDESRAFAGEEEVKLLLDTMAGYKLNRFHWHLTDSPGWRIEIKSYPKLTTVGSCGNEGDPDGNGPPQFYTQDQIREIIRYAKERHITVIPEIDMPGHADAAVRAYPELDGGGFQQKGSSEKWPHFTFNPGSPLVHEFRAKVFAEIAALFADSGVIHFGGDEVHFGWHKWQDLPEVREVMAREKLADNAAVEQWFGRETAAVIHKLGFMAGGWDEVIQMNLPPEKSLVFWWRHDRPDVLRQALTAGHPVVLCPRRPMYFDFIQNVGHKSGRTWKGINPLQDVYAFPDSLDLTPPMESKVLGIQACLWTENALTRTRREFLTWPRLVAVAEAAWTPQSGKNLGSFEDRLRLHLPQLKARGLTVFDPFENSPEVIDGAKKNLTYDDQKF